MGVSIRQLRGGELRAQLDAVAFLRIAVLEDYPYLYAGDVQFERAYLADFARNEGSVLIGAFAKDRLVGAATASPMREQGPDFHETLERAGYDIDTMYCFGESVLLREFRVRGIGHRFFDVREDLARCEGATHVAFCAIVHDETADHPARPESYVSPDGFWRGRVYRPVDGATVTMQWEEHGSGGTVDHTMQFWALPL